MRLFEVVERYTGLCAEAAPGPGGYMFSKGVVLHVFDRSSCAWLRFGMHAVANMCSGGLFMSCCMAQNQQNERET